MLTALNVFSWFKPKESTEKAKEEEELKTAQESSDISDLELENRQLRTAISYCDVVTAREPKTTESYTLDTNDLMKHYD